jgi:hypothetical protein
MSRHLLRLTVILMALLHVAGAEGQNPNAGGLVRYLMVLHPEKANNGKGPDVTKLGGRELERKGHRRLVEIPLPALEALRSDESVHYIALVKRGPDTDAPRYILGPREHDALLSSEELQAPPEWDFGVYTYDGSGNVTAIGADTYAYDQVTRLRRATVGGGHDHVRLRLLRQPDLAHHRSGGGAQHRQSGHESSRLRRLRSGREPALASEQCAVIPLRRAGPDDQPGRKREHVVPVHGR